MIIARGKAFYKKYERWVPIAFFILGFIFDTFMLRRVDELKTILQQALYLVISGVLISIELRSGVQEIRVPAWFLKAWRYREAFLHFLLGTLLNSYTIFYFKSASALTSFVFIILLVALLMVNEFKHFGKAQTRVHVAYWALALISYFVSLAPILFGFIDLIPFLSAVSASVLIFYGFYRWHEPRLGTAPSLVRTHLLIPFSAVPLLFVTLYMIHAIPPVPLSVSYMGIFHQAEKKEGGYELTYTRPAWKFWQHGDQTFSARAGDKIYCFVEVFSPTRFKDQLQVRWLFDDPKQGWIKSDAIPLSVSGGREEGYRAVTTKANYEPGLWRVQVETTDEREVGRIGFRVVPDSSTDERELKSITK